MAEVKSVPKTEVIDMADFLDGGILREKSFREKIASINWEEYKDKKVVLKGCDKIPVPTWAYLVIATNLAPHVKRIFWGEPCSAVPVYSRS